jgi:uncharacterized protein YyaL (SSP411 family)
VVAVLGGAPSAELAARVPLVAEKPAIAGRPTAYVCERRTCKRPVTDAAAFGRELDAS